MKSCPFILAGLLLSASCLAETSKEGSVFGDLKPLYEDSNPDLSWPPEGEDFAGRAKDLLPFRKFSIYYP